MTWQQAPVRRRMKVIQLAQRVVNPFYCWKECNIRECYFLNLSISKFCFVNNPINVESISLVSLSEFIKMDL